jgi:ABC-type transport system involved in multi-copper enzyme maturation permease subunit
MLHFFTFEVRYWLRSTMLWVFTAIVALLILGALSTDQITVGGSIGNTMRNAPFVIQQYYSIMWFITLLMTVAFVNAAASREFTANMHQILFTKPIRKLDFLVGRFLGAVVISTIPMLGISLGALLVPYMPWVDHDRFGPVYWGAHGAGIFLFALPNTFFIAAVLFTIAVLTRSTVISFIGGILLLVADAIASALTSNLQNEKLAALLDPFGNDAFNYATKYWTVAQRNTHVLNFDGLLLWNRLLWVMVGLFIFAFACWRFRFEERTSNSKKNPATSVELTATPVIAKPGFTPHYGIAARISQLASTTRIEMRRLMKTTTFIVLTLAALLNVTTALIFTARSGYGLSTRPVTYYMIDTISGSLYTFLIAMITFFAGVLVWEERDARVDEVQDALPTPEWPSYVAKLCALLASIVFIQIIVACVALAVQAAHHYTRFQLGLYGDSMLYHSMVSFAFFAVLAFFIHVISPNKYIGYFAFIGVLVANAFIWRPLHVASNLLQFGARPEMTYSDFFGYAPWIISWRWFSLYWGLFCLLLAVVSVLLWQRGRDTRWQARLSNARQRFHGGLRLVCALALASFVLTGTWIYYNTEVLNHFDSNYQSQRRMADYEKQWKKYQNLPQPRVVDVHYDVAIYPHERALTLHATEVIQNKTGTPLRQIWFTVDRNFDSSITMSGMALTTNDKTHGFRIYDLTTPMQPGEQRTLQLEISSHPHGFENQTTLTGVTQNGTFLNNTTLPQIGYQPDNELTDPNDRHRYGLKDKDLMPTLEVNCSADCGNSYISNNSDWVNVDTIISTSADQTAIAPGSLIRTWQQNNRNYYEYRLDHFALNFYSFLSAHYEVARRTWTPPNGQPIVLEVYYLKQQPWNVQRMLDSMQRSLTYYTTNFGPYYQREARIVEFPRVASFAQSFPGTMPYSESIGFIADIEKPDDIDMVYYVVAHEMAHQWWAHQVVGANMEGATSLSETLSQYSALMVMEKQYGQNAMRKFLQYEMDSYLRSRGTERLKERPLMRVEASQGYIHYRKGSVVMYYLRDMIGEDHVNAALRQVLGQYGYQQPPYPTSWALVNALSTQTPANDQYLMQNLFKDITIFSNRAVSAAASKRSDGKYNVTVVVQTHKYKADAKGNEVEVPMDDWVEIGALAAPAKGMRYGAVLARQRVHIIVGSSGATNTYSFVTDSLPEKAGVDPLLLLIDRIPDDNLKKVELSTVK